MAHTKSTKTIPIISPKYVSEFRCVGGDCPDTCCADWGISIDKDTFAQYRRAVHPTLKSLFKIYLAQDQKDSYALHARLRLRENDAHCPMHTEAGLCSVQQRLGPTALSDTCFMFPRVFFNFGERIEQHLTLSCPEAARLALTSKDAFTFVTSEVSTRPTVISSLSPAEQLSVDTVEQVRTFAIQLFQTQGLLNIEKLAALGWLSSQLDALRENSTSHTIDGLLADMTSMVETGALTQTVAELSERSSIGVMVFYILFKNPASTRRPLHQQAVMDQVVKGLGLDTEGAFDLADLERKYRIGLSLLRQEASAYEQIMGRYLLNDLLREAFPWGQTPAMLQFRQLLTRFGILRMMLAGVAAFKGSDLDPETITMVTQVFCRLYQHNSTFSDEAEKCLKDLEWNTLERLYTLLN